MQQVPTEDEEVGAMRHEVQEIRQLLAEAIERGEVARRQARQCSKAYNPARQQVGGVGLPPP